MASPTSILSLLFLVLAATAVSSVEVIRMYPKQHIVRAEGDSECESWKYSIEVNNAGTWKTIRQPCLEFVKKYFDTGRYLDDSRSVAELSLTFARSATREEDKENAWIFDVDETLLSNMPYYKENGFGSIPFNEIAFNEWVERGKAPALPESLSLYHEVKEQLKFKIFILTGRSESQRVVTEQNLKDAGYSGWEEVILRGPDDEGKKAIDYKSDKRAKIAEKYTIQGNSGDQWSDLIGYALAKRSFKLPNPMYYIP